MLLLVTPKQCDKSLSLPIVYSLSYIYPYSALAEILITYFTYSLCRRR
jgi:hypothetical protein